MQISINAENFRVVCIAEFRCNEMLPTHLRCKYQFPKLQPNAYWFEKFAQSFYDTVAAAAAASMIIRVSIVAISHWHDSAHCTFLISITRAFHPTFYHTKMFGIRWKLNHRIDLFYFLLNGCFFSGFICRIWVYLLNRQIYNLKLLELSTKKMSQCRIITQLISG